jgi:hypothetical protein
MRKRFSIRTFVAYWLLRIKRKLVRIFFLEQWSILICGLDELVLKLIWPPENHQWADPFPVEYNDKTYIFIEQQIGHENGTLGYIELYPDLTYSDFIPILEKNYHLSFPNVFCLEQNNQTTWYMIPETHENNTIDLYKAIDFPDKWVYEMTLIQDVKAVDSTVFFYNSKWWLLTSVENQSTPVNANLSLFYSDTFPSDSWTPHPQNPLHASLKNARMAGAVFFNKNNGRLTRPAQNCLKDYGKETNINEIDTLDINTYQEHIVKTIIPERHLNAVCTHTFNYSEHYLLRDIKTRRLRLFL